MKLRQNELWIYYDKNSASHRKTKAYAYSVSKHVQERDFNQDKLTKLMWQDILSMLKMKPKEIMNKANPKYQSGIARHEFEDDSWLEILVKNPDLVKAPIAIMNEKAILCCNPKDVYKLSNVLEDHAELKY